MGMRPSDGFSQVPHGIGGGRIKRFTYVSIWVGRENISRRREFEEWKMGSGKEGHFRPLVGKTEEGGKNARNDCLLSKLIAMLRSPSFGSKRRRGGAFAGQGPVDSVTGVF